MWHFRGTPPYLTAQARRIGMSDLLADRAKHNAEIHKVSILLGQLCERWHKARKEDGRPVVGSVDLAQIVASLTHAEQECSKLHALAGAAALMIDEARAAWGLPVHDRGYAVLSDSDSPSVPTPKSNGAVHVSKTKVTN